jgi:hypothetical protein
MLLPPVTADKFPTSLVYFHERQREAEFSNGGLCKEPLTGFVN